MKSTFTIEAFDARQELAEIALMNKLEQKPDPLRLFRQKKSKKDAYMGGYDFGVNGATDKNCHPMFFFLVTGK